MKLRLKIFVFLLTVSMLCLLPIYVIYNFSNKPADVYTHLISKRIELNNNSLVYLNKPMNYLDDIENSVKIVTFIYTSCPSCIEELQLWKKLLEKVPFNNTPTLFIAQGERNEWFEFQILKQVNFTAPIYYDFNYSIEEYNELYEIGSLHTFLLNSENKIIAYGSPVFNKNKEEEFTQKIVFLDKKKRCNKLTYYYFKKHK